jgi:ABC-type ATPase with predicted acetyltransferase domain
MRKEDREWYNTFTQFNNCDICGAECTRIARVIVHPVYITTEHLVTIFSGVLKVNKCVECCKKCF